MVIDDKDFDLETEAVLETQNDINSSESVEQTEINEGLVEVLFKNLKTSTKVSVSGNLVYFRMELMDTKTFFTIRVKRSTLESFVNWVSNILKDVSKVGA
jgi:hypothetical protein